MRQSEPRVNPTFINFLIMVYELKTRIILFSSILLPPLGVTLLKQTFFNCYQNREKFTNQNFLRYQTLTLFSWNLKKEKLYFFFWLVKRFFIIRKNCIKKIKNWIKNSRNKIFFLWIFVPWIKNATKSNC